MRPPCGGASSLTVNLHLDTQAGVPQRIGGPAAVLPAVRRPHGPDLQEAPLGQDLPAGILLTTPGSPHQQLSPHRPRHEHDGAGEGAPLPVPRPRSHHTYPQWGAPPVPLDVGGRHGILRALQQKLPPCHSSDAVGLSNARDAERCCRMRAR